MHYVSLDSGEKKERIRTIAALRAVFSMAESNRLSSAPPYRTWIGSKCSTKRIMGSHNRPPGSKAEVFEPKGSLPLETLFMCATRT